MAAMMAEYLAYHLDLLMVQVTVMKMAHYLDCCLASNLVTQLGNLTGAMMAFGLVCYLEFLRVY